MKLKSYKLLFHFFSFLADKTDGRPFFVRYKLLLGTLILTLIGTTARASGKVDTNDTIRARQQTQHVKCYDVTVVENRNNDKTLIDSILEEAKGVITTDYGEPLAGAIIKVKGGLEKTSSDIDGNFSIKVNANDTLIFSSVGFRTKEVLARDKRGFSKIILDPDVMMCYDIVIVDYRPNRKLELDIRREVKGVITAEDGETLPGVTIKVKGGLENTSSDVDGNFSIKANVSNTLIFSYPGMNTQEIPVAKMKNDSTTILIEDGLSVSCYIVVDPVAYQRKQNISEVKGVVTDEDGEPLIGVTVKIKDSSSSTFSDIDGVFSIKAIAGDTLVFSHLEFKTRELSVSELKNGKPITMYEEINPAAVVIDHRYITCYIGSIKSISDEVKGIVRDKSGEAIVGAQIQVKNRGDVTASDLNGRFSLNVIPNDILVVSYFGMNTQEIPVHKITNDSIVVLKENDYILCYESVVVQAKEIKKTDKYGYNQLDTQPVSPEGDLDDFQKWLENGIRYNEKMRDDITEEILMDFVVDKNGKLTDKKIFTNVSKETKKEILRVLSLSGRWQPGERGGEIVKSVVSLSINLLLSN